MTLGERIKACRQQAGMSQEKVAELMGISRQAVTKWETNKSAPSTENLFTLAEIFGTTVDLLMPEQEAETKTTEQVLPIQFSEPKNILTIAILIAILFFLCWNAGQNVGEDIGKFIYNLTH